MVADVMTKIQSRPHGFMLEPIRAALVVIDMQRDFLEPGGFGASLGNDVSLLREAVAPAQALLAACRAARLLVIHTRECHLPDLSDCPPSKRERGKPGLRIGDAGAMGRILVKGEPGVEIIPELAPMEGEVLIDKPGKGAFYKTGLGALLSEKRISQLILAGVTTEVCVQTTMREANDRGFDCVLAEDATESYFPAFKQATLKMVRAQGGIVGWTANVAAIVKGLTQ